MMKPIAIAMFSATVLAGCAQKPEAIKASYVSPTTYSSWNCTQLAQEAARVDNALVRASAQQNRARSNDTMGVIFLGLPVSSLSGGNVADQVAELKGHQQVLRQTQIRRSCT